MNVLNTQYQQPGFVTVLVDMVMKNSSVMQKLRLSDSQASRIALSDVLKPVAFALHGYKLERPVPGKNGDFTVNGNPQIMADRSYGGLVNPLQGRVYSPIPKQVETKQLHYDQSIPITSRSLFGVEEFAWTWFEEVGVSEISSESDNNSNKIEVIAYDEKANVHNSAEEYVLPITQIFAALHNDWAIPLVKALAHAKAKKRFIHDSLILGIPKANKPGLYTHPKIGADASSGLWKGNPDFFRTDLAFLIGEILRKTWNNHAADTLHLPPSLYTDLLGQSTNAYDARPLMQYLRENEMTYGLKDIQIRHELETASSVGGRSILAYEKTEDSLEAMVDEVGDMFPHLVTPEEVIIKSKVYVSDLQVHFPKSARLMEGM
jgi:hypothetical protein